MFDKLKFIITDDDQVVLPFVNKKSKMTNMHQVDIALRCLESLPEDFIIEHFNPAYNRLLLEKKEERLENYSKNPSLSDYVADNFHNTTEDGDDCA